MMSAAGPEKSINVGVPPEAWEQFKDWCDDRDRKTGKTLGRVLMWFLRQEREAWDVITDEPSERMRPLYARVLRKIADELESEPPAIVDMIEKGNPGSNSKRPAARPRSASSTPAR
jgi:hypothetical protein